ncbi:MAG: hypothetical protein ACE5FC_07535 [Myxococcota bacterium]
MAPRILAVFLIALGTLAWGCKGDEKTTPAKVYEPPKLRSEADRKAARTGPMQNQEVRITLKMTKEEVEEIQGQPESLDVIEYTGSREVVEQWRYPSLRTGCRRVHFTNGKVSLLRDCVGATNTKPKGG